MYCISLFPGLGVVVRGPVFNLLFCLVLRGSFLWFNGVCLLPGHQGLHGFSVLSASVVLAGFDVGWLVVDTRDGMDTRNNNNNIIRDDMYSVMSGCH